MSMRPFQLLTAAGAVACLAEDLQIELDSLGFRRVTLIGPIRPRREGHGGPNGANVTNRLY